MLFSLFILSCIFSLVSNSYYFLFLSLFFATFSIFLSPYFYSFSLFIDFYSDEVSLFMTFMLCCVIFLSSFWVLRFSHLSSLLFLLFSMLMVCYVVFSTSNLFYLYVAYEISLIPIILIIIIWGSYPERSLRSLMLLLYTSIFTIPFIFVLFYVFNSYYTFNFSSFNLPLPSFISLIVFLVFAVKLPIYGLHFWLPMAHVEAPTFGSMILAGILLKLGGVGLIRCYSIISWSELSSFSLSYFMVFLLYVTLVCASQSDFKRLVAYSSVSHIIVIPIMLIRYRFMGFKGIILVLLFHGFSSPLLFSIVGLIYSIYSTRQLLSIRGILLSSPLLSLICILGFMFRLCVPPFPSYVSEVMFYVASINLWFIAPIILALFGFLSLIYNLNWLSSVLFSSTSPSVSFSSFHFSYLSFYSMFIFILVGILFIVLFPYI